MPFRSQFHSEILRQNRAPFVFVIQQMLFAYTIPGANQFQVRERDSAVRCGECTDPLLGKVRVGRSLVIVASAREFAELSWPQSELVLRFPVPGRFLSLDDHHSLYVRDTEFVIVLFLLEVSF